jgi:hypothetical protein
VLLPSTIIHGPFRLLCHDKVREFFNISEYPSNTMMLGISDVHDDAFFWGCFLMAITVPCYCSLYRLS